VTGLANTTRRYHLRLTDRFFLYDPDHGVPVSREWQQGAIVTDQRDIELLEARGAQAVRIETSEIKND
jgi:hypothetical protein